MDGLTLLERAKDYGFAISLKGGDLVIKGPRSCSALVDEIGRHKYEVMAALRDREAMARAATWNRLAGERWGDATPSPAIDIPTSWRWEVACWPIAKWTQWKRRSDELLATEPAVDLGPEPDPDALAKARADRVEAIERRAYDEMVATGPDNPLRAEESSGE